MHPQPAAQKPVLCNGGSLLVLSELLAAGNVCADFSLGAFGQIRLLCVVRGHSALLARMAVAISAALKSVVSLRPVSKPSHTCAHASLSSSIKARHRLTPQGQGHINMPLDDLA